MLYEVITFDAKALKKAISEVRKSKRSDEEKQQAIEEYRNVHEEVLRRLKRKVV